LEYAEAVAGAEPSTAATDAAASAAAPLPDAAERVLRAHAVSFATSLALGVQHELLDLDCAGRFRAWGAPESPLLAAAARAEIARIETNTSEAGAPAAPSLPPCARRLAVHHQMPRPR
jgi:hypothetical protein